MDKEKQRIAIAEACGWSFEGITGYVGYGYKNGDAVTVPDFINDLNAMHVAWLTLPENKRATFDGHLCVVTGEFESEGWDTTLVTNATAAQRAEAFLRTIGKWEDA